MINSIKNGGIRTTMDWTKDDIPFDPVIQSETFFRVFAITDNQ